MSSIKTCFVEKADDQGEVEKHVTGVAIRLKDPDAEEEIELQQLGYDGQICDDLKLRGQLTRIEASLIQTEALAFALDAVRYQRESSQKTYGFFLDPFSESWDIPEDRPVLGLFGQTNPLEETVVQMGLIFLDTQCQARLE